MTNSLRFQIAAAFFAVVFFAMLILNLYPATTLRNLLINAKKGEMLERGISFSASLEAVNLTDPHSIQEGLSRVFVGENESVAIANLGGEILYATDVVGFSDDEALVESLASATLGFDVFHCRYNEARFTSSITMPIMKQGNVQAVLHVLQIDVDSSKLLADIRNNILSISLAIAVFGGILVVGFVRMFSGKVSGLLKGVRQVGTGNYSYKIPDDGMDEISQVAYEFNLLSDKLKQVEIIRQEFVSNASHELKTPLASIKLLSDSIVQTDKMSKEDTLDFLKDINSEIDRLIRITENLLYITKNDSRPVMPLEPCNPMKIAQRCRELLMGNASYNGVDISVRSTGDLLVLANSDMLYQIIFNIMENAIKYNREGGRVNVTIEKQSELCKITIADTGIGMPQEELQRIFDRFYRIDKARSRTTGGTGLGLSIVGDNLRLMGGKIQVQSQEEVGSKFSLTLPLVP